MLDSFWSSLYIQGKIPARGGEVAQEEERWLNEEKRWLYLRRRGSSMGAHLTVNQ
jgi:hypothetical protein